MWTEIDRMATEAFARKQGKDEGKAETLNQVKMAIEALNYT